MRVLVVTPYPVLPPVHGGRVRTYRLAEALAAAGAHVEILCPWSPGGQPLGGAGLTVHRHVFAANVLPVLFRDAVAPPLVALSWQPFSLGPRRRLRRFAEFDVVQFDHCAHPAWMEHLRGRGPRVVYSAHDVEHDYELQQPRRGPLRSRMASRLDALERRTVQACDLIVACTEADARRLAELYAPRDTVVVANGYPDELADFDRSLLRPGARASFRIAEGERVMLFVGGPAAHNREAVDFLEGGLMPELAPDTRLLVAGECAQPGRGAHSNGRVTRLGYVPDLRPVLAAADLAVNPVAHGTGSSVKLVEYLAARLPVVTTPAGARGLEREHPGVHVSDRSTFADAVGAFASGAGEAPPPPTGLSWSSLGRELQRAYQRLIES